MIVTENMDINGKAFVKTYSDSGCCVVRDDVSYSEAIDPAEFGRTYTEGDVMEDEVSAEIALAELMEVLK